MNKLAAFSLAFALVLGLSSCSSPEAEFGKLMDKADQSLSQGDYELAKAYVDEALTIQPGDPVAVATSSKIMNVLALDRVKLEASNESFWAAFGAMSIITEADKLVAAKEALTLSFEGALGRYRSSTFEIEEAETLLQALPLFIQTSTRFDQDLVAQVYLNAIEQSRTDLTTSLDLDPQDAIETLNQKVALGIYEPEDLADLAEKIVTAFEKQVLSQSKELEAEGNIKDAERLLVRAASRAPDSELIKAEKGRVGELVLAEYIAALEAEEEAQAAAQREQEEAQAAAEKEREDEKKRALSAMFVKEDTFDNIEWYFDKNTYSSYAGNKFLLYIGQREGGTPQLWLRFMMYDSRWHFFERIVIDVDGSKYEFNPGYSGVNRNNGGGDVWEWYDRQPTSKDLSMIEAIIESKSTRIRYFDDDNFYEERTVSSAQKKALANVLLAFEVLSGQR